MPDVTTSADVDAFMTAANAAAMRTSLGLGTLATQSGTFSGTSSGTNTGDQTNITGNAATVTTNANLTGHVTSVGNAAVLGSFTKAQLDAAVSDGNVLYVGDAPTSHNHAATEITSGTLPVARLAFTKAELSTAVSDGDVLFVGDVSGAAVTVRDIDGTPSIAATTIEFTNGTVSDQGSGVARVTISGSGDALVSGTLDQFADVTQAGGATLAISASTTLNGGTHSGTNTGDQTNITGNAATVTTNANLTGPVTSTGNATAIANGAISNAMLANSAVANLSGTNTGDQTITLTGMVTGSGTGSFVASLGSFTKAQLNTAISDGDALFEPLVMPLTAMGALAIDVTKYVNTKSISADSTMTFSNNTPTAGTRTEVRITTDATARTVTLPSCYSFARNASITTVLIPASSTASLSLEYTGSRWEIYGDPVETTGSGSYVLATSPTLVTPALGTPASGTLTNCTGLPTAGIVDDAVTYAKLQNVSAASRLLGRGSAGGAGDAEELTIGSGLTLTGTELSASGGGGGGDMLSVLTAAEISVTTTATLTIGRMHVCSGTSADYTVTLPAVSGNTGKFLGVRMAPGLTKLVTVDGNGTELIDGQQTRAMWANEVAILFCDGSAWTKVAGKSIAMVSLMAKATNQSAVGTTSETKYQVDTIIVDSGSISDTVNKRVNIKRAGLYLVNAGLRFGNGTDGLALAGNASRLVGCVELNGAVGVFRHQGEISALSGCIPYVNVPSLSTYAAGDYLECYGYHNYGSDLTIRGSGATADSTFSVTEQISW